MTFATLVHPVRDHSWSTPTFFVALQHAWASEPALWRSIATGLGMAILGLAMAGTAFGFLTP